MRKSGVLLGLAYGERWELLTKKATKVVGVDLSRSTLEVADKLR